MDWTQAWTILATAAAVLAAGMPVRALARRVGLPAAVSMPALGMLVGVSGLEWIPAGYLDHAGVMSRAAFVVLLVRAGLTIAPGTIRRVWPAALLLGVVPAVAEAGAVAGLSRAFLFERWDVAVLAGCLAACVSPAVVLPAVLRLKSEGRGIERLVPDRMLGFALVNAVVASTAMLLLLDRMTSPAPAGGPLGPLVLVPAGLLGGAVGGLAIGAAVGRAIPQRHAEDDDDTGDAPPPRGRPGAAAVLLGAALATAFGAWHLGLDGVLAAVCLGTAVRRTDRSLARAAQPPLALAWSVAEVLLFVNLGAMLDATGVGSTRFAFLIVGLLLCGLAARLVATRALLAPSPLTPAERNHVMAGQTPKATVQAVFAPILALGLAAPQVGLATEGAHLVVLGTVAILITAPVGAIALERTAGRMDPAGGSEGADGVGP